MGGEKNTLEKICKELEKVTKRLDSLETSVGSLKAEVGSLKAEVGSLKEQFEVSQLRVNALFEVARLQRPAGFTGGRKPDFGKYVLSPRGVNSTHVERKRGPFYW